MRSAPNRSTLAFGHAEGDGWHATQEVRIRNVSTRRLLVRVRSTGSGGWSRAEAHWVRLKPGGSAPVTLRARLNGVPPDGGSAEGAVLLVARGAGPAEDPLGNHLRPAAA